MSMKVPFWEEFYGPAERRVRPKGWEEFIGPLPQGAETRVQNPSAALTDAAIKYGDVNPAIKNKGLVRDSDLLGLLASGDEEYVSRARNQELVTAGTGTKKLEKQLATARARLRARGEIAGGEDRLVSDKTVGVKAPSVQAEYDKVWNKFYQEGRQMGLDDTDSKSYVRLMLGKSEKDLHFIPLADVPNMQSKGYEFKRLDPSGQTAEMTRKDGTVARLKLEQDGSGYRIIDTPITSIRARLTREAVGDSNPYEPSRNVLPEDLSPEGMEKLKYLIADAGYNPETNIQSIVDNYSPETPSSKKLTQQIQSTPTSTPPTGRRQYAGKVAKFLIPLITGTSAGYLLSDALQEAEAEEVAELLNQPIS